MATLELGGAGLAWLMNEWQGDAACLSRSVMSSEFGALGLNHLTERHPDLEFPRHLASTFLS